jgi:hypothetical protein
MSEDEDESSKDKYESSKDKFEEMELSMLTSDDKSSSRPITAFRKDGQLLLMFEALRDNRESEILDRNRCN